ncbi:MAG: hypothetical protein ACRETQ_02260 [Gammaproteobacteria bacterium]
MNVWPSRPQPVKPADWRAVACARTRAVIPYHALCTLAGVPARVSGPDLDRRVHILAAGPHAYPVGFPDEIGVAFPRYRGTPHDALRILEILAYGFNDYAAREAVRGQGLFLPNARPGRTPRGKALTGAERMRRLRRKTGNAQAAHSTRKTR